MFDVGIDIVEIERIKNSIEKFEDKFVNRIYSKREQSYCNKKKNPYPSYAARFAAKEAYIKFKGNSKNIKYNRVEVINSKSGKHFLFINDNKTNLKLSISHSQSNAVAIIIGGKR